MKKSEEAGKKMCIVRVDLVNRKVTRRNYLASERLDPASYVKTVVMPHFSDDPAEFDVMAVPIEETWVEDEVMGTTVFKSKPPVRLTNGKILYAATMVRMRKLTRPEVKGAPKSRFKVERFLGDLGRLFAQVSLETGNIEAMMADSNELTSFGHTFFDSPVPFTVKADKIEGQDDFAITFQIHETTFVEDDLLDLAYGVARIERIAKKIWRVYNLYHGKLVVNHGF